MSIKVALLLFEDWVSKWLRSGLESIGEMLDAIIGLFLPIINFAIALSDRSSSSTCFLLKHTKMRVRAYDREHILL